MYIYVYIYIFIYLRHIKVQPFGETIGNVYRKKCSGNLKQVNVWEVQVKKACRFKMFFEKK